MKSIPKAIAWSLQFLTPVRLVVIAAIVLFFWLFVLGDRGIYQLRRLLDMKNRLIKERQVLNEEIDRLTEEKKILSDPANIEMVIRKELGYIHPGEVVFEEKNDEGR